MSFSSVSFFVFMIAVFLIYWGIPHKFRYILLICANIMFYASFGLDQIVVLVCMTTMAYALALFIDNKYKLCMGLIALAAPLLIYKYLNFAIYAVGKVFSRFSPIFDEHTIKLLAPIGISFYTFELISYVCDVYKGKIPAEKNFLKLFVFAGFFANITSGPIERADKFLPQIELEKSFDYDRTVYGLRLVMLGMIKKTCGADVLKQYVDSVFSNIYAYRGPVFIVAIVLYTFEIYLDFSGYTDMARGFAYTLGFELTENFMAPYLSKNVSEFWRRWHISLSQWLRDYIYIPLGGSRCSKARKYINLMITFLVSGIWHGANFTFIVWGILHGIYQCASDFISGLVRKADSKKELNNSNSSIVKAVIERFAGVVVTFVLVSYAWMFFRANSLSDAKYITFNMLRGENFYGQMLQMGFLHISSYVSVCVIILATIIYDVFNEKLMTSGSDGIDITPRIRKQADVKECSGSNADMLKKFGELNFIVRWVIYIVLGVLIVVLRSHVGAGTDFIYFSF